MKNPNLLADLEMLVNDIADDPVSLDLETDLLRDVGLDSIDIIDLIDASSEHWKIPLKAEELNDVKTPSVVRSLLELIEGKLLEQAG